MDEIPEIDLTDPAVLRRPVHRVRTAPGSARRSRSWSSPGFGTMWAVTRHAEARAMLADPGSSSRRAASCARRCPSTACSTCGPCRRWTGRSTPGCAGWCRPPSPPGARRSSGRGIARIVESLLDDLAARAEGGAVDLLAHFARPLPMDVICELVGIPERRPRCTGASTAPPSRPGTARSSPTPSRRSSTAPRPRSPQPGRARRRPALRADRHQAEDGDRLSDTELVTLVWHLVLAGPDPDEPHRQRRRGPADPPRPARRAARRPEPDAGRGRGADALVRTPAADHAPLRARGRRDRRRTHPRGRARHRVDRLRQPRPAGLPRPRPARHAPTGRSAGTPGVRPRAALLPRARRWPGCRPRSRSPRCCAASPRSRSPTAAPSGCRTRGVAPRRAIGHALVSARDMAVCLSAFDRPSRRRGPCGFRDISGTSG